MSEKGEGRLRLAGQLKKPDTVFAQEGPDVTAPKPDAEDIKRLDAEVEEKPEEPKKDPPRPAGPQLVRLDQETILKIELLATKKKLAEANERLAMIALSDAKTAMKELEQEEALLLESVRKKYNFGRGNVKLLDRAKGICQVG